ncbi:MAG: YidC/Oxa1 family insertase periplasmic-domain containing protein [Planctomycetota bacterium]|jgi:YidC/Oxa1 family membrane protein insertase
MPRQILTFIVVFGLIFFAMRACNPPDTLPPAIASEAVPDGADSEVFTLQQGDATAVLAPDGSVASLRSGDDEIVGAVAPWRRPFSLLLRYRNGSKRGLPASEWKSVDLPGGREFTFEADGFAVTKRVLLADDGSLTMHLKATGAGAEMDGFEITGVSGVRLDGTESMAESTTFRRFSDGNLVHRSFADIVQQAEGRRARALQQIRDGQEIKVAPDYTWRSVVEPGKTVAHFGVVGESWYLLAAGPETARALSTEAYRAVVSGNERPQLESWASVDFADGVYAGQLALKWGKRAAIADVEPKLADKPDAKPANEYVLENDTVRLVLTEHGAAIKAMWLKQFTEVAEQVPGEDTWVPILRDAVPVRHRPLILRADPARYGTNLDRAVWAAVKDADVIRFTLKSASGHVFEKVVRLPEPGKYDIDVTVRVQLPDGATDTSVNFTLVGPAGSYIADAYRGTIGDPPSGLIIERRGGDTRDESIDEILKGDEPFVAEYKQKDYRRGLVRAVAVRGVYFVCALITEELTDAQGRPAGNVSEARINPLELSRPVKRLDDETSRDSLKAQITCDVPFEAGAAESHYKFYAGPNRIEDLRPLQIEDAVDFSFFATIGRFLMWLMKMLQGLTGSYGVAIMLMTLIVRAALMPVSYRTQLGMMRYSKRIQKIKPLLDEITKKYANNKQKLNTERMRIMKENKVGFPLGCLMIFFQIPIWIALFGALRAEFDIRHQPFLWAADLSLPDHLFDLPFWPHMFNLLPIVMLVLWVTQQKLAPTPGSDDPQVQMQMKMVKFMPFMFFIFLYKYAAALSVYMCVSSAWGIVESKAVRRAVKRAEEQEVGGGAAPAAAK